MQSKLDNFLREKLLLLARFVNHPYYEVDEQSDVFFFYNDDLLKMNLEKLEHILTKYDILSHIAK